jgi:uncharacterized RDD family membrane protein YckC
VAVSGGELIAVIVEDVNRVRWGRWPIEGGAPLSPLKPIPDMDAPVAGSPRRDRMEWVGYVGLFALLAFVIWRRRDAITQPAILPPGLMPAQLSKRTLGFVLDLLPAVVSTLPFWWEPLNKYLLLQQEHAREVGFLLPYVRALWWPMLITRLVYAGYCLVWELWRGNTPGKMVAQLAVLSMSGRPCRRGQTIARNLIRIIELEPLLKIWPLLVVVVVTRNRQRLGDVWARTIVVERAPLIVPPIDKNTST